MAGKHYLSLLLAVILSLTSCSWITHKTKPPGRSKLKVLDEMIESADCGASWSVEIRNLTDETIIYQLNKDKCLISASNVKLFTTAAALHALGPDFKFRTTLFQRGAADSNGVLQGDLIVIGEGDPAFCDNFAEPGMIFLEWGEFLARSGITGIAGSLIALDTLFAEDHYPASWEWGDLAYSFAVPVNSLNFNENCYSVSLYLVSDDSMNIEMFPPRRGMEFQTGISITPFSSSKIVWSWEDHDLLHLKGTISAADTVSLSIPADNPEMLFIESLEAGLLSAGIEYNGANNRYAVSSDSIDLSEVKVLLEHESPSLAEIVYETNRESINLFAESVLRIMGIKICSDASIKSSLSAVDSILADMGLNTGSFSLADGSGLSRHNWIPASSVNDLLKFAYYSDFSEYFIESLPEYGEGTLEKRELGLDLHDLPASTDISVRAKTGSMTRVRALSGYIFLNDTVLSFSIICNNYSCPSTEIEGMMDLVLELVIATVGGG